MFSSLALVLLLASSPDEPPPPPPVIDPGDSWDDVAPPPALDDEDRLGTDDEDDAPAPAAPEPRRPAAPSRAAPADEAAPDFLERYFPMTLDAELHPKIDDNLWSFWAGTCLAGFVPFAQVWLPIVLVEDVNKDYILDALIIYLLHIAPVALTAIPAVLALYGGLLIGVYGGLLGFAIGSGFGGGAGGVAGCLIPLGIFAVGGGCFALWGVASVVNNWWCMPVALANSYSRALYKQDSAPPTGATSLPLMDRRRHASVMAY